MSRVVGIRNVFYRLALLATNGITIYDTEITPKSKKNAAKNMTTYLLIPSQYN